MKTTKSYKHKKLKDLENSSIYLSRAIALLDDANYVLSLKHYKDLVKLKLKLESLLIEINAGYKQAEYRTNSK